MERLVANLSGSVRRERLDGRDYLVAPLSMLVPGVLNGSIGPGYYPPEEISTTYEAWNGMPITNGHPTLNGKAVSGRSPEVWEKYGLGYVFNVLFKDKLRGEGWFDVEKTKRVNPTILTALENNQKLQLSTGLGLNRESTRGSYNGTAYDWVARNHRPDHLAVLTNEKGACSIEDGCGVNNSTLNKAQETESKSTIWQKLGEVLGITNGSSQTDGQGNSITVSGKVFSPGLSKELNSSLSEDSNMGLTAEKRTAVVNELITNCNCSGFKEEDRKILNEMDDCTLEKCHAMMGKVKEAASNSAKLTEQESVVNAARKGLQVGNDQYTLDERGEWIRREQKPKEQAVANAASEKSKGIRLEDLPEELREDIAFARNAKQTRKSELIRRLVANVSDPTAKKSQTDRLEKRSLVDLEADVDLLPPMPVQNQGGADAAQTRTSYFGQAIPAQTGQIKKPEPLGIPVWNFDKAASNKSLQPA